MGISKAEEAHYFASHSRLLLTKMQNAKELIVFEKSQNL
jgi:hypothetical protein